MQVKEVVKILQGKVLCGEKFLNTELKMACGCDLLSDVLTFIKKDNTLLLTGLTSSQTIYIADNVNIKVICFVRGKKPDAETVEIARKRGLILFYSDLPMFEACGKLFDKGLVGCAEYEKKG